MADETIWQVGRFNLLHIYESQAEGVTMFNDTLYALDVLVQCVVGGTARLNPPASPTEGEAWVVGTSGTALGDWTGREGEITFWRKLSATEGEWRFLGLRPEGFRCWNLATDTIEVYNGSTWETVSTT